MDRITKLLGRKPHSHGAETAQVSKKGAEPEFGLKFVLENGEAKTFGHLPVTIGRSETNDLIVKDNSVSASHARVYYEERVKEICIMDCDSLNGLFINDLPTRKNILHDGAKIRLGAAKLTFWDTGYIHP